MIAPRIGHVVWFQPTHAEGVPDLAQPLCALVSYVHGERCVNVGGFDANGAPFAACSVKLLQDDDEAPTSGYYAQWPHEDATDAKPAKKRTAA